MKETFPLDSINIKDYIKSDQIIKKIETNISCRLLFNGFIAEVGKIFIFENGLYIPSLCYNSIKLDPVFIQNNNTITIYTEKVIDNFTEYNMITINGIPYEIKIGQIRFLKDYDYYEESYKNPRNPNK